MSVTAINKGKEKQIINTQIKIPESLHIQLKKIADERKLSLQAAGKEALEFWVLLHNELGPIYSNLTPKKQTEAIEKAYKERIIAYFSKERKKNFEKDSLFKNIIGMSKAGKNLSKTHDRYFKGE